jgi:choloylglycine hydrolase
MKKNHIFIYFFILIVPLLVFRNANGQMTRTGIDSLATISSFEAVGNFYRMDYSGDYNALLDEMDDLLGKGKLSSYSKFECSLFSANANPANRIFGRNFDNPQNDVLLTRYNPPDGFSSLAFTRLSDLGYAYGTDFDQLAYEQKLSLLRSAYFVPDGINETGLATGLASVDPVTYVIDPSKDTIFITRLIREILDHAQTLEEAANIANNYNVFDSDIHTISHHLLVGSPSEGSVTLEFHGGEFKVVVPVEPWQALTNIPVYNVAQEELMNSCWRYNSLYNLLDENGGELDWTEGMNGLETVHINCPWSAIYDLNNNGIYIAVHNNYEDIAYTDLEGFNFILYVGIDESASKQASSGQVMNYPNPFRQSTAISFDLLQDGETELIIYDCNGKRVKTLLDGFLPAGKYNLTWSALDDRGTHVLPGIYWSVLHSGCQRAIAKMVLLES